MPPEPDDSSPVNDPSADDALNQKINSALTSHLKRFAEKQLPALLTPMFESALKPLHEKLAAPPAHSDEDAGKSKGKDKVTPEMQALQAQLEDFKTKFATESAARAAAEKKSRDDKAQNELRAALQPHVKSELLDILSDHLYHRKSAIDFEDDGTPIFRSRKTNVYGEDEEVRLPLKAGVEQFLKSADAKPFLPAPGSSSAPPMKKPSTHAPPTGSEVDTTKMTDAQKVQASMDAAARFKNR